ncbi:hypothetical protein FACS189451_05850 [Bacteroidia bacterium]|nr:hypothetical protein FACS189451_05850 [Bacteroidia bacterium]
MYNMKQIYQSIACLFAVVFLLSTACTDNFEEINTRTDRLTSVDPEYIFGLTTVATLRELSSNNNWFFFGNYSQQWAVLGGGGPHFGFDGRSDRIWSNLYTHVLNPLYKIIDNYEDNPAFTNRVAIAKIWKSYAFSQIVGLYGPCPYTHACNGEAAIPFDTEDVVYRGILKDLKDAYTALSPTGDTYPLAADPFLGKSTAATYINRWSQFAHCIRLRTAIRLTEVPEQWAPGLAAEARQIVAEELDNAEKGLLTKDNTDNFYMTFGEDLDNQNPLYKEVIANPELATADPGNFPVIHESLILWVSPDTYNDPCLKEMMDEGSGGSRVKPLPKYLGRPHSMERPQDYAPVQGWSSPYDGLKYGDFSRIAKRFSAMTANFWFFSYPELCFIRAEATLKGYWTKGKTAEAYYYDGIDARCAKYSISGSAVTTYKNFPGIKWSTPSDTATSSKVKAVNFRDYLGGFTDSYLGGEEDNFKRIVVQHWISLFSQNIDIYTLLRRTEVIPFKPHFGADQNNGYIDARWGYTPERIIYPGGERNINKEETLNAILNYLYDNKLQEQLDQVTFRLIYAKWNPGLPAPQLGTVAYNAFPYPLPNMVRNR